MLIFLKCSSDLSEALLIGLPGSTAFLGRDCTCQGCCVPAYRLEPEAWGENAQGAANPELDCLWTGMK